MPLKFIRNDITRMQVDAIVNTANPLPVVGVGTDTAVYNAAGREKLLAARQEIGPLEEGQTAITPGFDLPARFILHTVSPQYIDGRSGEEEKLRACYRGCLDLAVKNGFSSLAFPLIASGNYGYPRDVAPHIAISEIRRFLLKHDMLVCLVLFDADSVSLAEKIDPDLDDYISQHEVDRMMNTEYRDRRAVKEQISLSEEEYAELDALLASDTQSFAEYLVDRIRAKGLKNAAVYNNAYVSKQLFSRIIRDPDYHPGKQNVLCLAVGAQMTFPEAVRLLSLAGYTFSENDKMDIIFSYFIRHHRCDIYEIENALGIYGLSLLPKGPSL